MKRKLTNNLGLKILSVLVAFVIWLVILNVDDPTITAKITGINVKTINGDSITSAGMYYEVESNSVVSVMVKGKKSIVDTLTASDFYAEADLSKYSITNAVPIEVGLARKYTTDPEIIEGKTQTMMLSVEDYITKQHEVIIQIKGEPAQGYYVSGDEIIVSPNRINVSAPKSVMDKIAEVKVDVYVNDVTKDFRAIAEPKAYDANGIYIKSDKIKFGASSVSVSATLLRTKSVDVVVETTGTIADGYMLTKNELTVDKLEVAGAKATIDKLDKIVLSVDVDGLDKDYKNQYNLKDYLPSDVKIISEDKECDVTLGIEKMIEKSLEFSAKDIKFLNLRNDVTTDYDSNTKLILTVRGLSTVVEELEVSQFAPHIDMSKLVIGTQSAKVSFEEVENIEITKIPQLTITLKDVTEQAPIGESGEQTSGTGNISTERIADEEPVLEESNTEEIL